MDEFLKNLWYSPRTGFGSAKSLLTQARRAHRNTGRSGAPPSHAQVTDWLSKQTEFQVHQKQPKQKYDSIVACPAGSTPDECKRNIYQFDLAEMRYDGIEARNNGFRYIALVQDVYSRFVALVPCKRKKTKYVKEALQRAFKILGGKPNNLTSDLEGAILSSDVQAWLTSIGVKSWQVPPTEHRRLGIVERTIRTVREHLEKYFRANGTRRWIDALSDLQHNLNNTIHSTTKQTPESILNGKASNKQIPYAVKDTLDPGTQVRILKSSLTTPDALKLKKATRQKVWTRRVYTVQAGRHVQGKIGRQELGRRYIVTNGDKRYNVLRQDLKVVPKGTQQRAKPETPSAVFKADAKESKAKSLRQKEDIAPENVVTTRRSRTKKRQHDAPLLYRSGQIPKMNNRVKADFKTTGGTVQSYPGRVSKVTASSVSVFFPSDGRTIIYTRRRLAKEVEKS